MLLPYECIYIVKGCPDPGLEGHHPPVLFDLEGKQLFHLGSHLPCESCFLQRRKGNLDHGPQGLGFDTPDIIVGHLIRWSNIFLKIYFESL